MERTSDAIGRRAALKGIAAAAIALPGAARAFQARGTRPRARDLGIVVGNLPPGPLNAITDVAGVRVGHRTRIEGDAVRTGVTAIVPAGGNLFQQKLPAAIFVGNGFGKLAGSTQVEELGQIETPIVLTNTLAVGTAMNAVIRYTLSLPGNEAVGSVNAVVGETNDGYLNDIRRMAVTEADVLTAISDARDGAVAEGNVGAGTGTIAFTYKGGIGTASRRVRSGPGPFTVGVLVQTNYGALLEIRGVPLYSERALRYLQTLQPGAQPASGDGSCMIVIATDAPLDSRNLRRLAQRAMLALGRTGSSMSNGSGDYAIAFSTAYRIPHQGPGGVRLPLLLANDDMSPLFEAVVEAAEEAVYNSLLRAETMTGQQGRIVESLSIERVRRELGARGALSR